MIHIEAKKKRYQELNVIIPAISLTGSCSKESRRKTKRMLKRVRSKTDLELDEEEAEFFKDYCYSPRHGTPIADRIVATNCLASLFFTKEIDFSEYSKDSHVKTYPADTKPVAVKSAEISFQPINRLEEMM